MANEEFHIDDFVNEIESGEVKDEPTHSHDSLKVNIPENTLSDDVPSLISALSKSEDVSTHNLAFLLSFIYRNNKDFYEIACRDIYNYLDEKDGNLVYIGQSIDGYKLNSTISFLKRFLPRSQVNALPYELLHSVITFTNLDDIEFNCLAAYLRRSTGEVDQDNLKNTIRFMTECYEKGDKAYALDAIRKLVILVANGLNFEIYQNSGCYSHKDEAIYLSRENNGNLNVMHELGHAIDLNFSPPRSAKGCNEAIFEAKMRIRNNPEYIRKIDTINLKLESNKKRLYDEFVDRMEKQYGSVDKVLDFLEQYIQKRINNGTFDLFLYNVNLDEDTTNQIISDFNNGTLDIRDTAEILYDAMASFYAYRALYNTEESVFLDIISNIFKDKKVEAKGRTINLEFFHTRDYYFKDEDSSMKELYANIYSLLLNGKTETLKLVQEMIGDDLYNYIINTINTGRIIEQSETKEQERLIA